MIRAPSGTGSRTSNGYWEFRTGGIRIGQHVAVAEKALGRKLKRPEQVHHFNEVKTDNSCDNLVICPNMEYHKLLHARKKALDECGDANKRKCTICKKYDFLKNLSHLRRSPYHSYCYNEWQNLAYARRKKSRDAGRI